MKQDILDNLANPEAMEADKSAFQKAFDELHLSGIERAITRYLSIYIA